MFSKACEYGIRASIYITLKSLQNVRVSLKDIAKEIDSPEAFTAKILQQLAKSKIIDSVKGPSGGFDINKKKIETITLTEIVKAIDGDSIFEGCGLGLKKCSEKHPCPVHNKFKKVREDLKKMIDTTTLYELSLGLKDGSTFLKH
ncbi:MAG: Rrf2 family transcriptional regulator [Bacteroidia bacterium]